MFFVGEILMYLLSFCLYKDIRAEHGLRGFMPRNIITPYECRRHEVRGGRQPPTPASERRESHKFPSSRRLHKDRDNTPHFATRYARRLVRGYSFSLLTALRPVLRTLGICLYVLMSKK